MLEAIKNYQRERQLKKVLRPFWEEVKANLELYYVMDQRQAVELSFVMDAWAKAKDLPNTKFSEVVMNYVHALEEYNMMLADHKEYQTWYSADSKNKTRENGKQLHEKKNRVISKFKNLDQIIIPARDQLAKRLLEYGILK